MRRTLMHRAFVVWTLGLTAGTTAPAVAAQDVGIELPVVPAAVVAARGEARLLRVAATADAPANDTQLALGPRTVTVEPGTTVLVEVAVNHLNRIVTPFAVPQVRTVSSATTEVDGNVVYVATPSEEPIALYLSDGGDSRSALSLTLAPRHVPPREVRLQLSGGPWRGGIAPNAAPCQAAAPHVEDLVGVVRELAHERRPPGYDLRRARRSEAVRCTQPGLSVTAGQVLEGHDRLIVTGTVRNTSAAPLELEEHTCRAGLGAGTLAVAAWPRAALMPGETAEVFVVVRARDAARESRDRPSLRGEEAKP